MEIVGKRIILGGCNIEGFLFYYLVSTMVGIFFISYKNFVQKIFPLPLFFNLSDFLYSLLISCLDRREGLIISFLTESIYVFSCNILVCYIYG